MPETSKQRSDTALTQAIADAITDRVKNGEPITRRGCNYLLLDYEDSQSKIPISTYTSWIRRATVPIDNRVGSTLKQLVEAAREAHRKQFQKAILMRAENVLSETLNMKITSPIMLKRTNADGKIETFISEQLNPRLVEVQQRAAEFALRKLDPKTYGDASQVEVVQDFGFDLAQLRRLREAQEEALQLN